MRVTLATSLSLLCHGFNEQLCALKRMHAQLSALAAAIEHINFDLAANILLINRTLTEFL
jgi:hypothetical protein